MNEKPEPMRVTMQNGTVIELLDEEGGQRLRSALSQAAAQRLDDEIMSAMQAYTDAKKDLHTI